MEQVAALRKRWLVEDFLAKRRTGAIWTLHTRPEDFPLADGRATARTPGRFSTA